MAGVHPQWMYLVKIFKGRRVKNVIDGRLRKRRR
jgi:hypothetical protein